MPWQRHVADVMGEMMPNGLPAYREGIVLVMRQSGKTTWLLSDEIETGLRPVSHRIVYSAQTGQDGRYKLLIDQWPMVEASPLRAAFRAPTQAPGAEAIRFKNGSRIETLASGSAAGHGRTLDKGVIDEAFKDEDDRREQAMLPAMLTKPNAQLLIVSTMGTDASVYLNRKVDTGRALVESGVREGVAYFEWSVPADADIDDPAVWWEFMPAMGGTQSEAAVAHARLTMTDGEFRRAICNQRTTSDERVIPLAPWRLAGKPDAKASGVLTYAVEVSQDRDWAALAVAGSGVVELGDYLPGVGWVVSRLVELCKRSGSSVAVDARGPAGALIPELKAAGVSVVELSSADVTQACGGFYDAIADSTVTIRMSDVLDRNAASVARQPVGDAWRWCRRGDDVSPIVAVTLAWAASKQAKPKRVFAY